jgi:hypothetical protein
MLPRPLPVDYETICLPIAAASRLPEIYHINNETLSAFYSVLDIATRRGPASPAVTPICAPVGDWFGSG